MHLHLVEFSVHWTLQADESLTKNNKKKKPQQDKMKERTVVIRAAVEGEKMQFHSQKKLVNELHSLVTQLLKFVLTH